MTTRVIKLVPDICSEEDIRVLEALDYEIGASQAVISLIIRNGDTDIYSLPFYAEYIELYKKYEQAKQNFEHNFLIQLETENSLRWEINFIDMTVTFVEN